MEISKDQKAICEKYKANPLPSPMDLKVGISFLTETDLRPINGLRHTPTGDTTGWYIWAGEVFSNENDFFKPIHVAHLFELCPQVLKYLALPPGHRFLINPEIGYEDVWFDQLLQYPQ